MDPATAQEASTPLASAATPLRPTPSIVVVTQDDGDSFRRALARVAASVTVVNSVAEGIERIDTSTTGVIVDAPLQSRSAEEALEMLAAKDEARALPVFIAVRDDFSNARAQALYDDGATAVVAWPEEVLLLPRLVSELADVSLADHESADVDDALSEATRARLCVDPELAKLECDVKDGVAFVRGSLDSLWKVRRLRQRVSSVPGIVAFDLRGLDVDAPSIADEVLATTLRTTLSGTSDVEDQTVSVAVHDGVATLAGVVDSKRRLRRVIALAEDVRGIREIINHVSISSDAAQTGRDQADTLQSRVSSAFPDASVVVRVFGGIAVLSGSVSTLAQRAEIEEAVEDFDFIQRVVNKVDVTRRD
ncbi:MAG: BON domain-containing protein [Nannocystaceae bacterium]|nr:BON domain-containing protein [bacterium]